MNYALQIAHGLMLLGKADAVTAMAIAMYFSTPVQDGLKCPKLPVVMWAGSLLLLKKLAADGKVPLLPESLDDANFRQIVRHPPSTDTVYCAPAPGAHVGAARHLHRLRLAGHLHV